MFPASYCLFRFVKPCAKGVQFFIVFLSAQHSHILRGGLFTVFPMWCDKSNSLVSKGFIKRIAVIGTIPNNSSGSSHRDNLIKRSLHKFDFMRVSRIRVQGYR